MVGNVFFDLLTTETYDKDRNVTYPAWTVCKDKLLQISSDAVMRDKIARTLSDEAEEVIIPVAGTAEINTNMHLAMRKNLKDGIVEFLMDDGDKETQLISKDPRWIERTPENKAKVLEPFIETRSMINEAVSLNTEIKDNSVKVKENRSATKDRYMALAMFNYFCDKLFVKYTKEEQESDIDISDFYEIFNYNN